MTPEDKAKAGFVGVRKRRGRVNGLNTAAKTELPPMQDILRPELDAARKIHEKRPASPGVRVYPDPDVAEGWMLDAPHRDLEAWEIQVCQAFATRSHATVWTFLYQIAGLCEQSYRPEPQGDRGRWMPSELELNFILATIHSERPETPLQATLLAQMCAVHMLHMRIAGDALQKSWVDPSKTALVAKLSNAYANQTDTYQRMRGRAPKQTITVSYERHVHVHHHRHAHLHANPPVEGGEEFLSQAEGPNDAVRHEIEPRPALSCSDQGGVVVPLPRGEREGALSDARGRSRVRRTTR